MIDTLHTILTDSTLRDADAIQTQLIEQSTAGIPWYDEA